MIRRVMSNPPQPVSEAEFARLRARHTSSLGSTVQPANGEDTGDDEADGRSPIGLHVSMAVRVSGDNNTVLLAASPADHARAFAQAVMSAVRRRGDVDGGIPMIDDEGRPRPINIAIDAGVDVEGSGNVLGNEEHITRSLGGGSGTGARGKRPRRRKREDGDGDDGEGEGEGEGVCGHRLRRHMRRSSV